MLPCLLDLYILGILKVRTTQGSEATLLESYLEKRNRV